MKFPKLEVAPHGSIVKYEADRFAIFGQEISHLEDHKFIEIWNEVLTEIEPFAKDLSLSKIFWRAHIANSLFTNTFVNNGTYIECGTHLAVISRMIFKSNKNKKFSKYLFDTWNGIPLNQIKDNEPLGKWHNKNNYTEDTFSIVSKLLQNYDDLELVKGEIPNTLSERFKNVSPFFLHIDMNIEFPERKALEFFVPQMKKGSIVLLDDYGFQNHTKQRVMQDNFFKKINKIPTQLPTGQAFVIL